MSGYGQPPGGQAPPPGGGGFGAPPAGGYGPPAGFGQPGGGYQNPGGGGFAPGPAGGGPPQEYKLAGIFMLVSGIMNVLTSAALILTLIWICVGVIWVLPLAGGIFEIVIGAQIMSGKRTTNGKTASIIGLISAVLCFNIIGIVMEILALVWFGKPEVERYIATGQ